MRTVRTRTGAEMPALGQGTWKMGRDLARRKAELDALRLGLDLGMTLIDTAEMYEDAELVVAEAMEGRRDEVFLVTKVLPGNASRQGTIQAAERSLERLRTEMIDLYLLHWESDYPLEETLAAFQQLRQEGKILHYGLSNFDTPEMEASEALQGGSEVASNQILYNLRRRGVERRLLPWCVQRGMGVMAYSPFDEGNMPWGGALKAVADRRGMTPAQVALAWTLRLDGVVSIPKAATRDHVLENAAARDMTLSREDLDELDRTFPRPEHDVPLETA